MFNRISYYWIFTLTLGLCIHTTLRAQGVEFNAGSRLQQEFKQLADPATGKIPANIRYKELTFASTLPKTSDAIASRRSDNWQH